MHINVYNDVKLFYKDTRGVLMRDEARNLIPLGNIITGEKGTDKTGWRDPAHWFMAAAANETGIVLTAIMTPPHNITLYATDNHISDEALTCLINKLSAAGISVPGVMSDKPLAERFAEIYVSINGGSYHIEKNQRIYELIKVNPEIPSAGRLRPARESDMSFLPYWTQGFYHECFGDSPVAGDDAESYRYHITSGQLHILEDNGTPVSMAKTMREIQTVCGVGFVYTPPYFRGRGYASSCVARLSGLILERGFTKCVLYTDLANPVSNSIYQKIGYKPIGDSLRIKFNG